MDKVLLFPLIVGFFITFLFVPYWIKKARKIGLVWEDMNKFQKNKVAGSGGVIVVMGFIISVLVYVSLKTFYFKSMENITDIFAITTSVLMLTSIGLIDDLFGWQHGGLSKKLRMFLCLFAAIPLIVINAGESQIGLPILGVVNLGLIYPLVLIPLGIVGASTTFNMLAGFNGLETSQGIILLSALGFVVYQTGTPWLAMVCLCMVVCLLAFYIFNKNPAEVFPGDSLTYSIGGVIAMVAIFGNIEKIAVFFFIPYILETFLKLNGGLNKHSFGKPNSDDSLEMPYEKVYGLEHLAIKIIKTRKKEVKENDVVYLINAFQIVVIAVGLVIFRTAIFK
jgi:UDP-N-acetylglucosamine--dolichyl-phosphate N-acetylglucosaminephosphotransferase